MVKRVIAFVERRPYLKRSTEELISNEGRKLRSAAG
jgi:hypothetical protein